MSIKAYWFLPHTILLYGFKMLGNSAQVIWTPFYGAFMALGPFIFPLQKTTFSWFEKRTALTKFQQTKIHHLTAGSPNTGP